MKEAPITVGIGEPSTVRPWTASVEISSRSFHLLPCLDHAQAVLEDEIREEQLHCLPGRWARFPGLVCAAVEVVWLTFPNRRENRRTQAEAGGTADSQEQPTTLR